MENLVFIYNMKRGVLNPPEVVIDRRYWPAKCTLSPLFQGYWLHI